MDDIFQNATRAKIDDLKVNIIDLKDLLKNKESINRSNERNLVDQQDILALHRILKAK